MIKRQERERAALGHSKVKRMITEDHAGADDRMARFVDASTDVVDNSGRAQKTPGGRGKTMARPGQVEDGRSDAQDTFFVFDGVQTTQYPVGDGAQVHIGCGQDTFSEK